jgi:preprotein translocase subunit SecY
MAMIVYRLGTYIAHPGHRPGRLPGGVPGQAQGILGMFNMFSGGAVQRMAIFALNVMPYISASIIVQLLRTVYPPWEKLRKEGGEAGRKTLKPVHPLPDRRAGRVPVVRHRRRPGAEPGPGREPGPVLHRLHGRDLTGGTMFLMWLGEQITSRGVGNGVSLIIFAGIVARCRSTVCRPWS